MSAQPPHDQHPDASARPAPTPSVQEVLAACAAARTLSTPPTDPPSPATRTPQVPAAAPATPSPHGENARRRPDRNAA
jgi:hypothetical protein